MYYPSNAYDSYVCMYVARVSINSEELSTLIMLATIRVYALRSKVVRRYSSLYGGQFLDLTAEART